MRDLAKLSADSIDISNKVTSLFQKKMKLARDRYTEKVQSALKQSDGFAAPWQMWNDWFEYSIDFIQRNILFWDVLRRRGNISTEHELAGKPPVLHFNYETVVDARTFERPVNYALLRIIPPAGVTVDPKQRPFVIVDPRAGHGPGIGGFKEDSQVGVAIRAGHPVYFVTFFPDPVPGQTLLDVCEAERQFLKKVRELHPESPKPAVLGNCQGGWAAMMLASSDPEDTGPIVINGAPMSYWGGAWQGGEGDNPMRYAGGLLGGTWMASFAADLGDGVFDGAYLVQNMENLNPANTLWDKYYNVFANVDTEPPRFLDFERWWGGYFLLNREEIEWIVQDLFIGNKLWSGEVKGPEGEAFNLREIKSPIILFASMGDNITPPQQAFNWVADVYGSTEEIKARGQTIVGLLHQDVGHLGIFVSGKVAKKEYTEIVSVLKSIESLPPGLFGMNISESKGGDGKIRYDVDFEELELKEVAARLNRLGRIDEKPFEAVEALSEFNQRAYELFMQPQVQTVANKAAAMTARLFNPLRFQRWAFSDLNPWMWWLKPAAEMVQKQRKQASPDQPLRKAERAASGVVSASLDLYRDVRDAVSEAAFFMVYGNMFAIYLADKQKAEGQEAAKEQAVRDLPFVRDALASISEGGYPEAVARVGALLGTRGKIIPLSWMELEEEFISEYKDLLPDFSREHARRLKAEQDIIARFEPEKALETLPGLLHDEADRSRLLTLCDIVLSDKRMQPESATPEQRAMIKKIMEALSVKPEEMPRSRKAA